MRNTPITLDNQTCASRRSRRHWAQLLTRSYQHALTRTDTCREEQTRAEKNALFTHIIEHINNTLIPQHHSGALDAADLVYIASTALCEAAASVLFQNHIANDAAAIQRVTKSFCAMFEQKAEQVAEYQRQQSGQHPAPDQTSVWD